MKRRKLLLITLFSLLILLAMAMPASAQEGQPEEVTDDEVNEVAQELYCPICENVPLDVCPTQACADWRAEIRNLMENGAGEQEVKDYFVDRYGVRVLGEPPKQGFTGLVWVLPIVGLLAGLFILGRNVIQMRQAGAAAGGATLEVEGLPDEDAAYIERVEQELRDF